MALDNDPQKNWLIHSRLKQSGYSAPLYVAARDAYDLFTSVSAIKPLSNAQHGRVIEALSRALLDIEE